MAKVKNVVPGVKFKMKSGEVYTVIKQVGISPSGCSKLWQCNDSKSNIILAEWAVLDKERCE